MSSSIADAVGACPVAKKNGAPSSSDSAFILFSDAIMRRLSGPPGASRQ
jgi:hypothetical protein